MPHKRRFSYERLELWIFRSYFLLKIVKFMIHDLFT